MTRAASNTSSQAEGEDHVAAAGDCVNSIAFSNGFFWQTLWDLPENSDLKRRRESPFMLLPGDVVHVPSLRLKEESCATEQKHSFNRKGVPAEFEIIVTEPEAPEGDSPPEYTRQGGGDEVEYDTPEPAETGTRPIRNAPYSMLIDGRLYTGSTDANGKVKQTIPPDAREGILRIRAGTPEEIELKLTLGGLNPANTWSGMAQRLNNLGYPCGEVDPDGAAEGAAPTAIASSLRSFQVDKGETPAETVNASVVDSLKQAHGS